MQRSIQSDQNWMHQHIDARVAAANKRLTSSFGAFSMEMKIVELGRFPQRSVSFCEVLSSMKQVVICLKKQIKCSSLFLTLNATSYVFSVPHVYQSGFHAMQETRTGFSSKSLFP